MMQLWQKEPSQPTFTLPTFFSLRLFDLPCRRLELAPEPPFRCFYFSYGKHQAVQHFMFLGKPRPPAFHPVARTQRTLATTAFAGQRVLPLPDELAKGLQMYLCVRLSTVEHLGHKFGIGLPCWV